MKIEVFEVKADGERIECAALASGSMVESKKWAFFFAAMHSPAEMLEDEYTGSTPRALAQEGFSVVTFSTPGHGQFGSKKDGEYRNGLQVFSERLAAGKDVVRKHYDRTRAVREFLEDLTQDRLRDIAVGGISRGGYAALISAAALGPQVDAALLYAPVTRLTALSEFAGAEKAPLVQKNHLLAWVERMPLLSLYAHIGCVDERVGTVLHHWEVASLPSFH